MKKQGISTRDGLFIIAVIFATSILAQLLTIYVTAPVLITLKATGMTSHPR